MRSTDVRLGNVDGGEGRFNDSQYDLRRLPRCRWLERAAIPVI